MGEVFAGRYELVDPLGYGGMGAVWRSWDHKTGRYVAAKLLRQVDAMSLLRFVREQAFRIDHPHVVTPLSWAAEDDRVLYTMPIVRGGSVATLRNDFGALPYRWVAVLVDQLLDALDTVHNAGVVHRDLKPANLLLEPTGQGRPHLRLSDFGIAAGVGEPRLTSPSYIVGTPGYVAPEQLRGAGPEPRQDLYAVGVVAADLLVGGGEPSGEFVASPVTGPAPEGVPGAFWALLRGLTAERPDDRPDSAAAARAGLAKAGCVPAAWPPPSASDDEVEVFDHHRPLPPGWGPSGPMPPTAPGRTAPGRPAYPGGQNPGGRPPTQQPPAGWSTDPQSSSPPAGTQRTAPAGGGGHAIAAPPQGGPAYQTRPVTPQANEGAGPAAGQAAAGPYAGHGNAQGWSGPASGFPGQPGAAAAAGSVPNSAAPTKRSKGGRLLRALAWLITLAGLGMVGVGAVMLFG